MELKQSAFETVWIIDNYCNIKCFSMLLYVRSCMGKIACEEGLFIVMYSIEILTSVFKTINTLKSYEITILMMLKQIFKEYPCCWTNYYMSKQMFGVLGRFHIRRL